MMNLEDYSKRIQFYTGDIPPLLRGLLDEKEWDSCADLGCGDGALLYALHQAGYFNGKTVYAVDQSESRLDLVRQINSSIVCSQDDVCYTHFEDSSVDFLISTQVIEHVKSDADMVKEMHRILVPNGTIYLATVFKKWYGWYFYRCNGKWTLDPTHLREYTHDGQLLELFKKYDLEVLANEKTSDGRAVLDAVLRRIGARRTAYGNRFLKPLRSFTVPIPGYFIWEIVLTKN